MSVLHPSSLEEQQDVPAHDDTPRAMTRRALLGVLGASIVAPRATSAEVPKPEEGRFVSTSIESADFARMRAEPIHFEPLGTPLTPALRRSIELLREAGKIPSQHAREVQRERPTESYFDALRRGEEANAREAYERIRAEIPEIPPYSEQAACELIGRTLPHLLAPYGVFVDPYVVTLVDADGQRPIANSYVAETYGIRAIEHATPSLGLPMRDVQILSLVDLDLPRKEAATTKKNHWPRRTCFGSIAIADGEIKERQEAAATASKTYRSADSILDPLMKRLSDPEIVEHLAGGAGTTSRFAAIIAAVRILDAFPVPATDTEMRAMLIIEGRRILFDKEHALRRGASGGEALTNIVDTRRQWVSRERHAQINGILAMLRDGARPDVTLVQIFDGTFAEKEEDRDIVNTWILRHLLAAHAGVKAATLTPQQEARALLELPSLLQESGALQSLVDTVLAAHEEAPDEFLGSDVLPAALLKGTPAAPSTAAVEQHPYGTWALRGAVAGAAGYSIMRGGEVLLKRRARVKLDEEARMIISRIPAAYEDLRRLYEDLQLFATAFDSLRRTRSVRTLLGHARKIPRCAALLDKLYEHLDAESRSMIDRTRV